MIGYSKKDMDFTMDRRRKTAGQDWQASALSGKNRQEHEVFRSGMHNVKTDITELLQFERLISELSTAFINLPSDKIDEEIENGLRRIVLFLDFDRGALHQISKDGKRIRATHAWAVSGIPPFSEYFTDEFYPWMANHIRKEKKQYSFSSLEEFPPEATTDKENMQRYGVKSHLSLPLFVGGSFLGLLSFSSISIERHISDELGQRIRLVGEIFSNALIRKQNEESLYQALTEIRELKDQLEAECTYLREEIKLVHNFNQIIGQSDSLKYVLFKVKQVAPTDATVLILGETGTGKELIARSIHDISQRENRPFIKVDCATLPPNLIESDLLGHEKGAFTGAHAKKLGKFELADTGTIFLDEIGELPLELQSKLLRVIQDSSFERVGGNQTIKVDVRIIAATNRPLQEEVGKGRFRQDLWYRLNVFPITLPPLRERQEDIPVLISWLVNKFNKKLGKKVDKIPDAALEVLQKFSWPGNIRELENVIERAMINSPGTTLQLSDWNYLQKETALSPTRHATLHKVEQDHILLILQDLNWKIEGPKGAAKILGLKPSTLRDRMKKLGIKRPQAQL